MNQLVNVVAALATYQDKFLIAKRIKGDEGAEGKWEFPGGKIEKDETKFKAIKREMIEEFSLEVDPKEELITHTTTYPTRNIKITLIKCIASTNKLIMNPNDHSDYAWINIEDIDNFDFAKGDLYFVDYLKKQQD